MKKAKACEAIGPAKDGYCLEPKTLVVAILILIAIILLLSYHPLKTAEGSSTTASKQVCKDNAKKACLVGNCSGSMYCQSGEWSSCIIDRICVPGSTKPCVENYCAYGYKTCNDCGTGYGQCALWGS